MFNLYQFLKLLKQEVYGDMADMISDEDAFKELKDHPMMKLLDRAILVLGIFCVLLFGILIAVLAGR